MRQTREKTYRFEGYTLDAGEHRLKRGDVEVLLQPKTFEMLLYLVERQGRLVKRDELIDRLWSDVVVSDKALTQCIGEVRKALGDDAQNPCFIRTVSRLGYKFIAEVEEVGSATAEDTIEDEVTAVRVSVSEEGGEVEGVLERIGEWARPVAERTSPLTDSPTFPRVRSHGARLGYRVLAVSALVVVLLVAGFYLWPKQARTFGSIAVLPFADLSGDPEQEYFADGMTESLITELGQIRALKVISRTSVMQYKESVKSLPEIGRELNTDAVVEGSVIRSGDRVRVTAKVIEAVTDQLLWTESYDRDLRDILALQHEIARAIAREIRVTLTPEEQRRLAGARPVDPDAYEPYLKGRYFLWNKTTREGLTKAIEYYLEAIEKDPLYAPAYAGLASTYVELTLRGFLSARVTAPRTHEYAVKALDLDESLSEAHNALARHMCTYEWNWTETEAEYQRAIELNPNNPIAHNNYGLHLEVLGRLDESIREKTRACELDPLNLYCSSTLGAALYYAGQYDRAIDRLQRTLELDAHFALAHKVLGEIYLQQSRHDEAAAEFKQAGDGASLAHTYAVLGRTTEARTLLRELQEQSTHEYVSPAAIALVHLGLGEKDQTFEWLERAYDERDSYMLRFFKVDPRLEGLRSDPRFRNLQQRIGLQ